MSDSRAQGSLEFLLLIAGVILVVTVVLFLNTTQVIPVAESEFQDNVSTYQNQLSLNSILNSTNVSPPNSGNLPCGNLVLDVGESCDVDDQGIFLLGGASCQTLGFKSGALSCDAACLFVTSGCVPKFSGGGGGSSGGGGGGGGGGSSGGGGGASGGGVVCGDAIVNGSEVCDVLGNAGCSTNLTCDGCTTCSSSSPVCGNGSLDAGETCDIIGNVNCPNFTTCVSCSQPCVGDIVPPSINSFSLTAGNGAMLIQYAATDPNPASNPVSFLLLRGTSSTVMNALTIADFDAPPGGAVLVSTSGGSPVVDSPLNTATRYYYRLRACDAASVPNCSLSVVLNEMPSANQSDIYPPNIDVFSLTPGNASTKIHYRLTDPAPGSNPINFILVRGSSFDVVNNINNPNVSGGGTFTSLPSGVIAIHSSSVASGILSSFDDLSLVNGTTYYYRMHACDSAVPISNCSDSLTRASTPWNTPDGSAPTIDEFSLTPGSQSISLSFLATDNPVPATLEYTILRATGTNATTTLTNITATGASNSFDNPPASVALVYSDVLSSDNYVDTPLSSGTVYYYRLRVCDFSPARNCTLSLVTSASTNVADSTPPVINSISFTPGDFRLTFNYDVSDNAGVNSIYLMKTNNGQLFNGASPQAGVLNKFYLPYFDNPIPGMVSASIAVNGTIHETGSFVDEGVSNGIQYFYSVRVCDAANNCTVAGTRPGNSFPTSPKHPVPIGPLINISFGGSQEIIYHGNSAAPHPANDNCSAFDAPDLPLRAFRNQNNETIVIGSSAPVNYIWNLTNNDWSDPNNFVRECVTGPALPANTPPETPYYARQWLASPYILPNGNVQMIIHNEWHDAAHYSPIDYCYSNPSMACTLYSSTLATSTDGGHHYTNVSLNANNDHVTHAIPKAWDPSDDALGDPPNEGMSSQSNILKAGNYYYMLAATIHRSGDAQRRGTCLSRTSNLSDPSSWDLFQYQSIPHESTRLLVTPTSAGQDHSGLLMGPASSWNLDAYFTGSSRPVVSNSANNDDARGCDFMHGLGTDFVESVVYSDYLQKYVALLVENGSVCRFLFSVSPDLVRWSAPEVLKDFTQETNVYGQTWSINCHPAGPVYPSILDSSSTSDNFETIDNDAYLYWMNWWPGSTGGSSVDEIRQRIQFDCPNGC